MFAMKRVAELTRFTDCICRQWIYHEPLLHSRFLAIDASACTQIVTTSWAPRISQDVVLLIDLLPSPPPVSSCDVSARTRSNANHRAHAHQIARSTDEVARSSDRMACHLRTCIAECTRRCEACERCDAWQSWGSREVGAAKGGSVRGMTRTRARLFVLTTHRILHLASDSDLSQHP